METMIKLSAAIEHPKVSKKLKKEIVETFHTKNLNQIYFSFIRNPLNPGPFFVKIHGEFIELEGFLRSKVFRKEVGMVSFIENFKKDFGIGIKRSCCICGKKHNDEKDYIESKERAEKKGEEEYTGENSLCDNCYNS